MKSSYVWRDNQLVEITPEEIPSRPEVMDDLPEWHSTDGARIRGKAQWREHLKRTGTIEMGHADIRNAQENWEKRKVADAEHVAKGAAYAKEVVAPDGPITPLPASNVSREMANRLYNRPMPDRKTLIRLTLETARDLAKRR